MHQQTLSAFNVIGISVRTTNENGQSSKDIPSLWEKFMSEGIADQIPGKIDSTIYCIYTDYEKDHMKPYTTLLGCKVENLNQIPNGMTGKTIEADHYNVRTAKGNILQGLVFNAWMEIWNSNLQRKFTTDFEVYGEKAQNPENAEVDIFIAVK